MCGRFEIHSSLEIIAQVFSINLTHVQIVPKQNYNVAPTHDILVVKKNGERKLTQCRWGFLPHWAKDEKIAYKMINARAETVAEKPAFRKAFTNQRCLIITDGFYEWKKSGKVKKPIHVRQKSGEPLGLAGLQPILEPYPSYELEYYNVTQKMNSPKNNSPENIKPEITL